jgi:hypothetical protein
LLMSLCCLLNLKGSPNFSMEVIVISCFPDYQEVKRNLDIYDSEELGGMVKGKAI